jgi:tetratricopeptide (TPR) repeat protein
VLYARRGEGEEAAEALSTALNHEPGDAVAAFHYGQALATLGREEAAYSVWRRIGAAVYFAQRAITLRDDPKSARQNAERALVLDPGLMDGYLALGQALTAQGAYTQALSTYQGAILRDTAATDNAKARLYYEMGRLLTRHFDRDEEALEALERAVALDPRRRGIRLELAGVLSDRGMCTEAAQWVEEFLEAPPSGGVERQARITVGECYLTQGQPQLALPYLQEAVRGEDAALDAPYIGHLLLLAQAYRDTGQDDEARTIYEWILRLKPGDSGARRAIRELDSGSD